MDDTVTDIRKVSSANAWWNAVDVTKVANYEDLWDIMAGEQSVA